MLLTLVAIAGSAWSVSAAAPGPPTDLAYHVVGSTVTLIWGPPLAPSDPATSYTVQAAAAPNGPPVASIQTAQSPLVVTGVPNGTYYVRVIAVNADGSSGPSNQVQVIVGPAACVRPDPPSNVAAVVNGTTVVMTWTAPTGGCPPTGYVVQAGSESGFSDLAIVPVTGAGLTATAPPGTYFVRVHTANSAGLSSPSNEVTITVGGPCSAPGAPSGLISSVSPGRQVSFVWSAPSTGGQPNSYILEAGSAPGLANLATLPLMSTSFTTGVPPGTYFIRVKAQNSCGISGPSNEVTLTLADEPPSY